GVPLGGEVERAAVRRDRRPERFLAALFPRVRGERVLHFLERGQHGLLVFPERLLLPGVLDTDVRPDPPAREDGRADGGDHPPELAGARGQVARLLAQAAEAAEDRASSTTAATRRWSTTSAACARPCSATGPSTTTSPTPTSRGSRRSSGRAASRSRSHL